MVASDWLCKVENGVVYAGEHSFPAADISRISWGSIAVNVNGTHVGTRYLIYIGDNEKLAKVELGTTDRFQETTNQLWDTVSYPLAMRMALALKKGESLNFGRMVVRDSNVLLSKPSAIPFVGKPSVSSYEWAQIDMQSQNGRLWLYPVNDSKGPSGSASYIEDYNTEVLANLIKVVKSKGLSAIGDAFSEREYAAFESQTASTKPYIQLPGDKPNKLAIRDWIALAFVLFFALWIAWYFQ